MHITITYLVAGAALLLGLAGDAYRHARRRPRHRYASHSLDVAPGTDAQRAARAAGSADTIRFRPPPAAYQSGRPLYPEGRLW